MITCSCLDGTEEAKLWGKVLGSEFLVRLIKFTLVYISFEGAIEQTP